MPQFCRKGGNLVSGLHILQDWPRRNSAAVIYQDDEFVAFRDINAQAPVHALVIPRAHTPSIMDANSFRSPQAARWQLFKGLPNRKTCIIPDSANVQE